MEYLEPGDFISDDADRGAREMFEHMRENPGALAEELERDKREWPSKRRMAIGYIRASNRGKCPAMPDGLNRYDIERANRWLSSKSAKSDAAWVLAKKAGIVMGIVGGASAVVNLILELI